jgi:hypothetical protein
MEAVSWELSYAFAAMQLRVMKSRRARWAGHVALFERK